MSYLAFQTHKKKLLKNKFKSERERESSRRRRSRERLKRKERGESEEKGKQGQYFVPLIFYLWGTFEF